MTTTSRVTIEISSLSMSEAVPPVASVTLTRDGRMAVYAEYATNAEATRYYHALLDQHGLSSL